MRLYPLRVQSAIEGRTADASALRPDVLDLCQPRRLTVGCMWIFQQENNPERTSKLTAKSAFCNGNLGLWT